jgi:hypothetical protein
MKRGMQLAVAIACLMPLLVTWGGAAHALVLGNPSPDFKKGNFGIGAGLSDNRESIFADYGLTDAGTLEVLAGNLDVPGGRSGTELGVGYRHKLDTSFNLGKFPTHLGIMGAYRVASIDTPVGSLDFNLIDIGFGGSITPVDRLNTFAALVYERVKADTVLPIFGKLSKTDSNLGVLLGAEYWITPSFVAGGEVHPGLDDDSFAIYATFKF